MLVDNENGDRFHYWIAGKTAYLGEGDWSPEQEDVLRMAGYKIAEYPGGGNMLDKMKNYAPAGEDYEQYNLGDNKAELPENEPDGKPHGTFKCPECGHVENNWGQYLLHRQGEHAKVDSVDDGHFPELDMDKTLPPHFRDRQPFILPLASAKEASRYDHWEDVRAWAGLDAPDLRSYGAFRNGEVRGVATIRPLAGRDAEILYLGGRSSTERTALLQALQVHFGSLMAAEDHPADFARVGFVRTATGHKWSGPQDPKDQIDAEIPFVYDAKEDKIVIGPQGTRTSDIPGQFTPGGIVEGFYEPGGKLVITTDTNMPYSLRHFMDLWYHMHPHMEITGLDKHNVQGQRTRLAKISATNLGQYIKTLAVTDPAVWNAYQALRKEGEVYAVGGAPRDALLGKEPKDIDLLVTGIPPARVNAILEDLPGRVDLTGKNFGVYRYKTKGHEVEIALPRTERSTGDRRVDFDVNVDHTMPVEDDLLRRDFTVNSIAVNLDTGATIDPYGGVKDIEERRLHTTHPSSFSEDPTRLLRALTMHGRYGFAPDEDTRQEMRSHAHRLALESPDAIGPLVEKIMKSNDPARAMRLGQETGLLDHVFPDAAHHFDFDQNNPHHHYPLGEHHLNVLDGVAQQSDDPDLRMAAWLHDWGKPASRWDDPKTGKSHYYRGPNGEGNDHEHVGADMASSRLHSLRYGDGARRKRIEHLIRHHMFPAFSSEKGARKFLGRVGDEHADDLLTLRYADQRGKGQSSEEVAARTSVQRQRDLVNSARQAKAPTNISALPINGRDILALGVRPGPAVGQILEGLTNDVIEDPQLADRNRLLERAKEYVQALPAP